MEVFSSLENYSDNEINIIVAQSLKNFSSIVISTYDYLATGPEFNSGFDRPSESIKSVPSLLRN